ncbi:MAG: hypothetical protein AB1457_06945 [Chloroflexota bacterium]
MPPAFAARSWVSLIDGDNGSNRPSYGIMPLRRQPACSNKPPEWSSSPDRPAHTIRRLSERPVAITEFRVGLSR